MEKVVSGSHDADQKRQSIAIAVAGADLQFRNVSIDDRTPTGSQIIAAAGFHPVDDYGILQWLPSGDLQPVRLNETVRLHADDMTRFIIVATDRAFFFEIDGERQEWLTSFINGVTIKRLAGKDPQHFVVVLEREDEADEEIDDDQMVDMSGIGVEKFRLKPAEKLVEIIVNDKPVQISRGEHTGLEIKQAAIVPRVSTSSWTLF